MTQQEEAIHVNCNYFTTIFTTIKFWYQEHCKNRNERTLLRKKGVVMWKKHYYENDLGKAEFYVLIQMQSINFW